MDVTLDFFAFNTKLPKITILASEEFGSSKKKLPTVGLDLMIPGSKV